MPELNYSVSKANRYMRLWPIALLLLAPSFQYLFIHFQLLLSGHVTYWKIDGDVIEETGILRYVKDISAVVFIFFYLFGCFIWRSLNAQTLIYISIFAICVVSLGVLGFDVKSDSIVFVSGLRWLLHLIAALAVGHYTYSLPERHLPNAWRHLFLILFSLLFFNCFVTLFQLLQGGSMRLPGLFANAAVMSVYVLGLSFVCMAIASQEMRTKIFILSITTFSIFLSGSRVAIVIAILMWPSYLLLNMVRSKMKIFTIFCFLYLPLGAIALKIAEWYAGRGDALEAQLEGGRVGIFMNWYERTSKGDVLHLLFGNGLGYGTNFGFSVASSKGLESDMIFIADNGYLTILTQFGILGSMFLLAFFLIFLNKVEQIRRLNKRPFIQVYYPIFALLIWCFTQNPFEQFGFLIGAALGVALGLKSSQVYEFKSLTFSH